MILASLLHHVEDENLEILVVAALVCSCQCDFGNRLTSYTKKLTLELATIGGEIVQLTREFQEKWSQK